MPEETSFARLMEAAGTDGGAVRLRAGELVRATIIQVTEDWVFVDVGTPSDGRIARAELADRVGSPAPQVGARIEATVVDPRPDGPVLAVAFGHGDRLDTSSLELAQRSGTPVEAEVTRVVKGGLELSVGGARAFCPASQIELGHVADLTLYLTQRLEFKVLEVREGGRNVILSRRALLEDRRREAALTARDRIVVGSELEATVQSMGRHGAVVELEGVEGFIHLSELAAHRVERAEDVVRVGERVQVRVLSVEDSPKGLRVRLSMRIGSEAQGTSPKAPPPPDEVLAATVIRPVERGVIVQTARGEGFVPLRELGLAPGADHRRAFQPGKTLDVVAIGGAGSRLTFSATQVAGVEERKNYSDFAKAPTGVATSSLGSLGDVFGSRYKTAESLSPSSVAPTASPTAAVASPTAAAASPTAPSAPTAPRSERTDVIRRRR